MAELLHQVWSSQVVVSQGWPSVRQALETGAQALSSNPSLKAMHWFVVFSGDHRAVSSLATDPQALTAWSQAL
jgi:hypothetical protein